MSKEEGTNADETAETAAVTATTAGTNSPVANNKNYVAIPKCVCSWKNCRVYQKFFRDHPVWDGVIKLKFTNTELESMALKESIDRNLKVPDAKAHEWKSGKGTSEVSKYNVACHHWTEQHIKKYRADPKHYSFNKPFSVHGAQKYLYKVDPKETFKDSSGDSDELLYLQSPLVPKEEVKNLFYRIKEEFERQEKSGPADLATGASAQSSSQGSAGKEVKRSGSRRKLLKDHEDDSSHGNLRNEGKNSSSRGVAPSMSSSNPRRLEASDRKASMRNGLPSEERKDSLTGSSNRTSDILLQEKEQENKRLKDQLEAMQSQLSFLHDMVYKLQEQHYDHHSAKGGAGRGPRAGLSSGQSRRRVAGGGDGSSRQTGSRSSRSSVPNEIEIESEDDGNWVEEAIDEEWSEEDEEDDDDDEDDPSRGTFQVHSSMRRSSSFNSRASRTSRAASIVSMSKSVKSLPREIELDEDDEDSHESLEEEAFDNKSFASSKKQHRGAGRNNSVRGSTRRSTNARVSAKQPQRRQSTGANSRGGGSGVGSTRSGRSSKGSKGSDENSLSGVYQVTALTVTDPYGEQGTYTGSISNSTGMPHGFGRLEYDKAGRWYEGDWRHGRWTGQGRLSNGDGDFYEGGLKSDHKHGRGVMKFADGRIFEGEYINGQMVEGKMTYQDGSTYTGGWVDGMRHGRGRCIFTDQSVYEGEFREGEFFGFGKMSWSDGGWYEGEWFNGEMQGFGKEIRPDGSLRHEGQWNKGQPIRSGANAN